MDAEVECCYCGNKWAFSQYDKAPKCKKCGETKNFVFHKDIKAKADVFGYRDSPAFQDGIKKGGFSLDYDPWDSTD
jgi:hypothetical protein